jgi:hypothetical protein
VYGAVKFHLKIKKIRKKIYLVLWHLRNPEHWNSSDSVCSMLWGKIRINIARGNMNGKNVS